jgi:sarcosine oxidase subunit alpha
MSTQEAILGGFQVRLFRVSFSGELAFEINISSDYALELWQLLIARGEKHGITPYGTDAMHVLRAEKGFVIVGQDTDGSVTPVDLKLSWLLSPNKDFLGKRSLQRADALRPDRKQWVGLIPEDGQTVIAEGAQLIEDPDAPIPVPMCGHVSSSYRSDCLGHPIALGLVKQGRKRLGETVFAASADGRTVAMKIVSPVFYDPKGERQHV